MKVLLIKSISQYFPVGLLYLASELESSGIEVSILDYVIGRYNPQKFRAKIMEINPQVVGIDCFSYDIKPAFDIAKMTKETLPNAHIVMGGPHPTGLPEHTLKNKYVDSVVIGEGEKTLKELVNALDKGCALEGIKGLAYKDKGKVILNPPREYIEDLDTLLFPAYHLIDLDSYYEFPIVPYGVHGMITKHSRFMPIFTSRGCPYRCIYCRGPFGKFFRARPPENVLAEIEILYNKYGIREFHMEDDCFNVDLNRAEKILDLIVEKKLKISIQFPTGLRVDKLNKRFVQKLKKAGAFMIGIGIESASIDILKQMKKDLDLDKVRSGVDLLVKYGILVWGYFMIGFLNETRREIQQTIDFARRLKIHFVSFSLVTPLPGTELFELVKNRIDLDAHFSNGPNFNSPKIQLSEVPLEELLEIKRKGLKKFYNPIRILRIAAKIRHIREIKFYWTRFKRNVLRPDF